MSATFTADDCRRAGAGLAPQLAAVLETLPRPMVFVHGVFDLLHAGHVAFLESARRHGASLVVGLHGDASARRRRKGAGAPLNAAEDRARVVSALSAVSAVVLFDDDKPLALMCALRPDVHVKCGDQGTPCSTESALLAEWGGVTVLLPRRDGPSTRALIDRARRQPIRPTRSFQEHAP